MTDDALLYHWPGLEEELRQERLSAGASIAEFEHKSTLGKRVRVLCGDRGKLARTCRAVTYWMWRDRRVHDKYVFLPPYLYTVYLSPSLAGRCCTHRRLRWS